MTEEREERRDRSNAKRIERIGIMINRVLFRRPIRRNEDVREWKRARRTKLNDESKEFRKKTLFRNATTKKIDEKSDITVG